MEKFDFNKVPHWYAVCNNDNCPMKETCLRYLSGSHLPGGIGTHICVMPSQLKESQCRYLDVIRTETQAYGFLRLYDMVLKRDYTQMRKNLTLFFGGKTQYYQRLYGKCHITPEQQTWLRDWLRKWGYDWEFPFDRMEEAYVFSQEPGQSSLKV